jgi:hypothetical protein
MVVCCGVLVVPMKGGPLGLGASGAWDGLVDDGWCGWWDRIGINERYGIGMKWIFNRSEARRGETRRIQVQSYHPLGDGGEGWGGGLLHQVGHVCSIPLYLSLSSPYLQSHVVGSFGSATISSPHSGPISLRDSPSFTIGWFNPLISRMPYRLPLARLLTDHALLITRFSNNTLPRPFSLPNRA